MSASGGTASLKLGAAGFETCAGGATNMTAPCGLGISMSTGGPCKTISISRTGACSIGIINVGDTNDIVLINHVYDWQQSIAVTNLSGCSGLPVTLQTLSYACAPSGTYSIEANVHYTTGARDLNLQVEACVSCAGLANINPFSSGFTQTGIVTNGHVGFLGEYTASAGTLNIRIMGTPIGAGGAPSTSYTNIKLERKE
jgi:hypothetical protein